MIRHQWPLFLACASAAGLPAFALACFVDTISKDPPVGPIFWFTWLAAGAAVGVAAAFAVSAATRSEEARSGAGVLLAMVGALVMAAYGAGEINEFAERWAGGR